MYHELYAIYYSSSHLPAIQLSIISQCGFNYTGDGRFCSLDSDFDGYPAVAIPCEDVEVFPPFCRVDTCPLVSNVQNDTSACLGLGKLVLTPL